MRDKVLRKILVLGVVVCFFGAGITPNVLVRNVKADIDDGLVAYWSFDEGNGNVVHDLSGHGNDGTIHGANWVTGIYGSALEFIDTDIVSDIPSSLDDSFSVGFTICCWVYWYGEHPQTYSPNSYIFDARTGGAGGPYLQGFLFYLDPNGSVVLELQRPPYEIQCVKSISLVQTNEWTFVVGIFDHLSQVLRVYINAVEDNVVSYPYPYYETTLTTAIGNNRWAPGDQEWAPFNGIIDELRIYDRVLSESEIWELYNQGGENKPPVADFTWSPQHPGPNDKITFDASSSYDPDGTIVSYEWDWDHDGVYDETYTTPIVTHSWPKEGSYLVSLRVKDNNNSYGVVTKTVTIRKVFDVTWIHSSVTIWGNVIPNEAWMGYPDNEILIVNNLGPYDASFKYGLVYTWLTDVEGRKISANLSNQPYSWGEIVSDTVGGWETKSYTFEIKARWDWIHPWNVENIIDIILTILPGVGQAANKFKLFKGVVLNFLKGVGEYADVVNAALSLEGILGIHPVADIEYRGLNDSAQGTPFTIRYGVPPEKMAFYLESAYLMMPAGLTTLTAFSSPPFSLFLLAVQAGLILGSQATYVAAYDPDPNYKEIVSPKFVYPYEIDRIKDDEAKAIAYNVFTALGYLEALKDSYAKYQGAICDGNEEWALRHASAIRTYSSLASQYFKSLPPFIKKVIRTPSQEQINNIRGNLSRYGVPEYEKSILRQFGWSQQELDELGEGLSTLPDGVYSQIYQIPQLLEEAIDTLDSLSCSFMLMYENKTLFANVDANPVFLDATNLPSVLTCYVELQNVSNLTGYHINSALLNGKVKPIYISSTPNDNDGDGIPDIAVEYDPQEVIQIIGEGEQLLSIEGNVTLPNGEVVPYSGSTTIRVSKHPPTVEITKPNKGFYINDKKVIFFLPVTVIIGNITIEVNASDETDVNNVEIYIDNTLKARIISEPYTWTWSEKSFGKHTLKIVVYDDAGNQATSEIVVWKYF